MAKITKETTLRQCLAINPTAEAIFFALGMGCIHCLQAMPEFDEPLEGVMAEYGLGEDFLAKLNEGVTE